MRRGRELGHVGAGLGDDHVGDEGGDARDRDQEVPGAAKGFDHHLDPVGELLDGTRVLVDQIEMDLGQERVVITETSGERLGQLGDLGPQPSLRQLGELDRIALPGDERVEHQPAGHAADVARHRRQLDAGVLEELLQALDLPGPFPSDRRAGSGQVAELTDRRGWHERSADQTMRAELSQPLRVGDVGLATRQVLDVPRVDEHHLERAVLEQVIERLPVVARRFHHHQAHLLANQMITKLQHLVGDRAPRRDRRRGTTPDPRRRFGRRPSRRVWRYRSRRTADARHPSLLPSLTRWTPAPGRAGRSEV